MVVDGAAHFILNHVKGLALGTQLLAGDGHAAHPLRGALDEAVKVALPGGADHHDVVSPVVGGHAHAPDVILKAPGGDFCGDDRGRLGVDIPKVMGRGQGHRALQGL